MLEPGGSYPELADGKEGRRAETSGFTSIGPVRSGSPFESGESTQRASMKVGIGKGVAGFSERRKTMWSRQNGVVRVVPRRRGLARPNGRKDRSATARLCSTRARSSKAGRSLVRPA